MTDPSARQQEIERVAAAIRAFHLWSEDAGSFAAERRKEASIVIAAAILGERERGQVLPGFDCPHGYNAARGDICFVCVQAAQDRQPTPPAGKCRGAVAVGRAVEQGQDERAAFCPRCDGNVDTLGCTCQPTPPPASAAEPLYECPRCGYACCTDHDHAAAECIGRAGHVYFDGSCRTPTPPAGESGDEPLLREWREQVAAERNVHTSSPRRLEKIGDALAQRVEEQARLLSQTCGPQALEDLRQQCREAQERATAAERALAEAREAWDHWDAPRLRAALTRTGSRSDG